MAEDLPSREILKQLVERLDLLERLLAANTARLHLIERRLGIASQRPPLDESLAGASDKTHLATSQIKAENLRASEPTPSPTQPPTQTTPVTPPPPEPPVHTWSMPESSETPATHSWMNEPSAPRVSATREPSAPRTYATREAAAPFGLHVEVEQPVAADEAARAGAVPEAKRRDLESAIGGRWFNWIGIIAVTFGVAFFLKFAFDQQWIGPGGRIGLSLLVGVGLLYVGERLRGRGLSAYAYVLSGGGILILYLSDFAAYNFYHLIGQTLAFLLMAVVTTTAVLLSVRLNALPVAILGLVGGFLTPLLLSTGVDNEIGLFTYVALLDAGVLAVAYFKRWRSLDFLSFAGTVAITVGWALKFFEPEKVWTTLVFLSVFFLLYSLLAIFHNVLPGRATRWFDVALAIANATFYFGVSYLMLTEAGFDHTTPATQALLVSIFFTQLFYMTWRWSSDDRLLRYSYVGAAATFLTIAVAIQLELQWVTMAWAVEALMLAWVGLRSGETAARHAAIAVFCVAVGHWFFWDMPEFAYGVDPSFVPLLNRRALSGAVLVGAIAGAARAYRRSGELDQHERETVKTFLGLTGNAVALTLLSLDLNDFFTARLSQSGAAQADLHGPIENARQFSISTLWTFYAATMLALGVLRRFALLRWGGLLLLLAAIGKVITLDSAFYAASWHLPVFNQTFITYALLVAVLAFAAWLYGRAPAKDEPEQPVVRPVIIVAANVLALAALSLEILGYYDRLLTAASLEGSSTEIFSRFQEGRIFTLALVWTVYAACVFLVGAWRSAPAWRWGGLLLLTLTTPLVLANLIYYDAAWHLLVLNRTFGAFAIFVAALWLIARTYARSSGRFDEALVVRRVATVAANLFAIVALSTQAVGYYEAKIAEELSRAGVAPGLSGLAERSRNLALAKQLSLSVVWGLYASGLLIAGQVRRLLLLRVMGLALLSLTILKVFIWDLSSLDRIYRIISFIMLGAILLVVSYFYQRSQQRAEDQESGVRTQDTGDGGQ
jgi:uncharacterized membrane protein